MWHFFFGLTGRMRRRTYWAVIALCWLLRMGVPALWVSMNSLSGAGVDIYDVTQTDPAMFEAGQIYFYLTLITAASVVCATVRRLHDFNANGLWAVLTLVPGLEFLAAVVIGCIDSFEGTNQYGLNPKGVNRYYINGQNEEMRTRELADLARLYEKGYLTQEEFAQQKKKLLG